MELKCPMCRNTFKGKQVVCPNDGTLLMGVRGGYATATRQCEKCQAIYMEKVQSCPVDGSELSPYQADPDQHTSFSRKHETTRLVAKGTASKIFAGFEKATGIPVALKLSNISQHDPQYLRKLKRFSRPVEVHTKLRHKNIVKILDTGYNVEGKFYLAYELVEGSFSLANLPGKLSILPPEYFIQIFVQVCDTLDYACKQDVLHQDLSSGDVLISEGENDSVEIRIIDFAKGSPLIHGDNRAQQLTEAGDLFGHPDFMSPELCRGDAVDEPALIYSLGCIMYCTMLKEKPFTGSTWAAILLAKLRTDAPTLELHPRSEIKGQIESLINRCMLTNRSDRFASIEEIKSILLSLQQAQEPVKYSVLREQFTEVIPMYTPEA